VFVTLASGVSIILFWAALIVALIVASRRWPKVLRWAPLAIGILGTAYQIGDHFKWWDGLRGRSQAEAGLQRLSSPKNFPVTFVLRPEPEFDRLYEFISSETINDEVRRRSKDGFKPIAITRLGGTLKVPLGVSTNTAHNFAPDVSPVAFIYGRFASDPPPKQMADFKNFTGPLFVVANLGELREWISARRERERFFVSTGLLGVISLLVTLLELAKKEPPQRPQASLTPPQD
jgi:hypothetical protein